MTNDLVPVLFWEAYEEDAELDVADGVVTNHDELVNSGQTYREVRAMNRDSVETFGLNIIEPGAPNWHEEFEDLEVGDAWRLDELED